MLQLRNRVRCPHMLFSAYAECVFAAGVECIRQDRIIAESQPMQMQCFFGDFKNSDAFDIGCSALEVLVDQCLVQADRFENLGAAIRHVGRDAHLGHYLEQALADRFLEIVDRFFSG